MLWWRAGHSDSIAGAFQTYIGRGREFYRAKDTRTPSEVIAFVRRLGAIPVVAHPGVTDADVLIPSMVESGLLGIEAYHADHTAEQRAKYAKMAADGGLLATGGTDYHGPQAHNPELGSEHVPEECVRALLQPGTGHRKHWVFSTVVVSVA